MKLSPRLSVPSWTRIVATGPRPLSSIASMTTPEALPSAMASSSSTSDCSTIASRSLSTPSPVSAESGMNCVSPPQSSEMTSCWESSFRTRSGSASSLSILLTATIIGTPAARACWMPSTVCGMTPSSAATTSTTMSVDCAPRARIDVNAAWPGVSRNVMTPFSVSVW